MGRLRRIARTALALSALAVALSCVRQAALAAEGSSATQSTPGTQSTPPQSPRPVAPPTGLERWLNPATAPFIPVPEIDEDPYSGTTIGIIPTFLVTNERQEIRQIIAPDVIYNQNFGYGARGRIFSYPSANTQWSIVGGGKQRVESEFDGEYASGILRNDLLSFNLSVVYDRSGSPRFYGLGNGSRLRAQTNYTFQQKYVQSTLGFNLSHAWQIGYTFRARTVDVTHGHLTGVPSIEQRFPATVIRAEGQEILNRVLITYDSRDNVTTPTRGAEWVAYGGAASAQGMINSSLYSEVGIDGRNFWTLPADAVLAVHVALRYMPRTARTRNIPFWALSSIGGDRAIIGGDQPLRGFGAGRFRDRNSASFTMEYRKHLFSVGAGTTPIAIEIAPFVDMGRVFNALGTDPLSGLHKVAGIGFRGIAPPFVVGYVDVGYGSEGASVFTGLNYPF
jgi:hypothetical protein